MLIFEKKYVSKKLKENCLKKNKKRLEKKNKENCLKKKLEKRKKIKKIKKKLFELNLNTLRVDGEMFESGKKKLRIRKYPDMCGRGPKTT